MTQPVWDSKMPPEADEWLPALDIPEPQAQRRLTVLVRWLLLLPQFIVLFVLGIVAFLATVAGWFAALFIARLPGAVARYLSGFLAYETRVHASALLLVDTYPPFALTPARAYPVRIEVRPGRLNRLAVLFRIILMIPAAIVQGLFVSGWYAVSFVSWIVVLILGRMPRPLFEATAALLRFTMRYNAYTSMLTSAYPKRLYGERDTPGTPDQAPPMSATRPLRLSTTGTVLVTVFLVIGLIVNIFGGTATPSDRTDEVSFSSAHWATGL
ncbi:DUF4389 domain-containing protein [Streptomyces sp. NBC_00859]|uniref:DUF4389 domain-containing protein n=1 Tax=Streptomyces sp. NBC_00859 TaxID=2903682 RepID=UPI003868AAB8|nr:DUF4389 domain-containing protein [Streptomyces sp. NBC_00859]